MLKLTPDLHQEIKRYGTAAYPNEGCGLLLGRSNGGENVVVALYPAENRWPVEAEKPERFHIDSDEMLRAELAAMARDLDVIGIYHSHPDCEPVASPRDLAWATWPGYSYIITEVRNGRPGPSRSWQLRPDRSGFMEEDIVVIG